ncbi:MAG: hypothetical protein LUE96_06360 [Lachnospiraceae bacterium]|nr:hypothetical protein [Lachnospiraceae bacterium]
MGLFNKIKDIFTRDSQDASDEFDADREVNGLNRDRVDMHDSLQREAYIKACLEQMSEASGELDILGGEYNLVTSYLTDMEEIEALSPEYREQLKEYAKKLLELEGNKEKLEEKKGIMREDDFAHMERIEQFMPEGYEKLKEAEEYQVAVKKDLGRLDGERHAYYFRRNELINSQKNMKGITLICVSSMIALVLILACISMLLQLDVTIGYAIAVVIAAVALTLVYVRFHESQRELVRVEKSINKLVLLQNTVKIRYVNNTNLLEYLYVKYDVNSSVQLKKLWDKYVEELKRREEEKQMQMDMDENQAALIRLLRRCRIQDPGVWLHQVQALIDSKEMVEIRHELILRRQKLRKQMEYNANVAQEAQGEVKDIVGQYPEYAEKILDLVSDYEKALA